MANEYLGEASEETWSYVQRRVGELVKPWWGDG